MCLIQGGMGFHVGDGIVVTCYHGEHSIVRYNGADYPATYLCGTPTNQGDIAVLKTNAPFSQQINVAATPPPVGTELCWQGGTGRVTGYSMLTMHSSCRFRLGDSGGPVWVPGGSVVSVVSATRPRDSIGPDAATLYKYVEQARAIVGGKAQPQQKDGTGEITDKIDEILALFEQVNKQVNAIQSDLEQASESGRDAGPASISQQQVASISVAISQSLSSNEEFKAALRGPAGPQGLKGERGEQGPQGPPGEPGNASPKQLRQAVQDVLLGMSEDDLEQFAKRLPPIYRQAIDGDTGKSIGEPSAIWLGDGYRYKVYRHQDVQN